MAQRAPLVGSQPGPAAQTRRRGGGASRQPFGVVRQQARNVSISSRSNRKLGGSCHSNGPSLAPSRKTPDARKFARAASDLAQPPHMGDEARPLDREDEILGRLVGPAGEEFRRLQAVECAVDLDGTEKPRRRGQLSSFAAAPSDRTRRARGSRSSPIRLCGCRAAVGIASAAGSSPVGAPTGLLSGEPCWRSTIDSTTSTAVDKNSLCQFWKDSNHNCASPRWLSIEPETASPCNWACSCWPWRC